MRQLKRFSARLLWTLAIVLALFTVLVAALPHMVDQKPVLSRIEQTLSRRLGGTVRIRGIEMSLWPRPHMAFENTTVAIPGKAVAEVGTLDIYPELFGLLSGRFILSEMHFERPRVALDVPPEGFLASTDRLSPEYAVAWVTAGLSRVREEMPELEVSVDEGTLALTTPDKVMFWFRHLDAYANINRGKIEFSAESNLFEDAAVTLDLDVSDVRSEGSFSVVGFQPQSLIAYFKPETDFQFTDVWLDMDVEFETLGLDTLNASVGAAWPRLTVSRGSKRVELQDGRLRLGLAIDSGGIELSLSELRLAHPALQGTGKWTISARANGVRSDHSLELRGTDIAVAPVRTALTVLAPGWNPIRQVLEVLRAGRIPHVDFSSKGQGFSDLWRYKNMAVQGEIVDGDIHVPIPVMDLSGVTGAVSIRQGVLQGAVEEIFFADARGYDGALTLGLFGKNRIFKLDLALEAQDVHPLHVFLQKELKHQVLPEGVGFIRSISGPTSGRLTLGNRLDNVEAVFEANDFRWTMQVDGTTLPLVLSGDEFGWDGKAIRLMDINAALGKTTISGLRGNIVATPPFFTDLSAESATISLEEIFPFLERSDGFRAAFPDIESLAGKVSLDTPMLQGQLENPKTWRYRAAGALKNVRISDARLPGSLAVKSARFKAIPERLRLRDVKASLLDAEFSGSGRQSPAQGAERIQGEVAGRLGEDALRWLENLAEVPAELRLRAPLTLRHARFLWERQMGAILETDFTGAGGATVELGLLTGNGRLTVNKLNVKDAESDFVSRFSRKRNEIKLLFNGKLTRATLDALLLENRLLKGWIKGALQATVVTDRLQESRATGSLEAHELFVSDGFVSPLGIEEIALIANAGRVDLLAADLEWSGNRAGFKGKIDFRPEAIGLDLNAHAQRLDWNRLSAAVREQKKRWMSQAGDEALALDGVVRLKVGQLDYEGYRISPFRMQAAFDDDVIEARLLKAELCGVDFPGVVEILPKGNIDFKIEPTAKGQTLESTMPCLLGRQEPVSGTFDLAALVVARGDKDSLRNRTQGEFRFQAKDGKIFDLSFSGRILNRIFAVLNIPRLFSGKLPDLGSEGFLYSTFEATGTIKENKLLFSEILLDGDSMKLLGEGKVDLEKNRIEMAVMVAPLKTLDWLISKIPLINKLVGDGLAIIPVSVSGDLDNPSVIPMDPALIGSKLLDVAKQTFTFPFKLINPLFSDDTEAPSQE